MLCCGKYVECPWADKVKAILYMGLPGQAGGEAIADLLYDRATPGGKLAERWPCRYYNKGRRSCTPALWLWFKLYRICLL